MTYQQTIDFLYNSLPAFHRIGGPAYKANLDNTLSLDSYFDYPHRKYRSVHVAGTNGKGSVSHFLASVLIKAGYHTGLYTSPHLTDYTERIRVDGIPIPEVEVVEFVKLHRLIIETLKPSFFEISVAMAFDYFARQEVDIAVIEVGMGGRLDSTNIIQPMLSLITNIGWDHMQFLGDSLEKIAREKAGIIKPGIPVVIGESHPDTAHVFIAKARETGSPITFADKQYKVLSPALSENNTQNFTLQSPGGNRFNLAIDQLGSYQSRNILTVYEGLITLRKLGLHISDEAIHAGLRSTGSLTGLRGRWQILGRDPLIICDTGHNLPGIIEVVGQLEKTPCKQLHIVFGMVKDKEPDKILGILPKKAMYYFTRANIPRALNEKDLRDAALRHGLHGQCYDKVQLALEAAKSKASPDDLVFVGGSTFVVAEVI